MADKTQGQEQKQADKVRRPQAPVPEEIEFNVPAGHPAVALERLLATPPSEADPKDMLTLQRSVGNRALRQIMAGRDGAREAGVVQREDPDAGVAEPADAGVDLPGGVAADPEQEALQEFLEEGWMPDEAGEDVIGAGGRGGFNAKFNTRTRELIVTVNVGINFYHALWADATTGLVIPDPSGLTTSDDAGALAGLFTTAANMMSRIPNPADRVREVNTNWRWDDSEKDDWMIRYEDAVLDAWDNRHFFQSERWEELQGAVSVRLNVHQGDQDGDHTSARIIKTPPGGLSTAYVSYGSGTNTQDQGLMMSSSGTGPNAYNFLRHNVQFQSGSSSLDTATINGRAARGELDKLIVTFQAAPTGNTMPVRVTGRASATGGAERNQQLSQERADVVATYLETRTVGTASIAAERLTRVGAGTEGATEADAWCRAEVVIGSGEAQNTAAHEFGHMIGLGDEYAAPPGGLLRGGGSAAALGNPAGHNALAQAMGGGVTGAVGENTDSIMSVGNTVRPQHYATFHKAIEQVTDESWEYGGASGGRTRVLPAVGGPGAGTATA
jgi:outer membrane protein OmpA-like peptidoglycan-associated protein